MTKQIRLIVVMAGLMIALGFSAAFHPIKAAPPEAGYGDGFTVDFYSFPRADVPEMPRFIEAVAGYFGEVGVKTRILPTEYASYRKKRMGFDLPGAMGC